MVSLISTKMRKPKYNSDCSCEDDKMCMGCRIQRATPAAKKGLVEKERTNRKMFKASVRDLLKKRKAQKVPRFDTPAELGDRAVHREKRRHGDMGRLVVKKNGSPRYS